MLHLGVDNAEITPLYAVPYYIADYPNGSSEVLIETLFLEKTGVVTSVIG